MSFKRALVRGSGGDTQEARTGDGWLVALGPFIQDAPGPAVMQPGDLAGGLYVRLGLIADTADITPDAAATLDQFPTMDIGETVMIAVSNQTDFLWEITPGVDVTLVGKTSVEAQRFGLFLVNKTSETTITIGGL